MKTTEEDKEDSIGSTVLLGHAEPPEGLYTVQSESVQCTVLPCDITLYQGDCMEILPHLSGVDVVITDPPYKGYDEYGWDYLPLEDLPAWLLDLHGFWCWKGEDFPLPFTARHIWSKANRNIGRGAEQYEEIYEVNGKSTGLVFRHAVIDSEMNAQLNRDEYCDHPCQKPIKLMSKLVTKTKGKIIDPFMGSGGTGLACAKQRRGFIGIEKDPKHFEIAKERIERELSQLDLFLA